MKQNILVFGKYDPDYNRTKTLLSGLKKHGHEIQEFSYTKKKKPKKQLIKKVSSEVDWTFFPSFTHNDVLKYGKLIKSPIVFDPLVSKYMTKVLDYKNINKWSPRAFKNLMKDKLSMNKADFVLSDTEQHKAFYCDKFKIPEEKIIVVPIGINQEEFYPIEKEESGIFHVGFYGGFIPLQGTQNIIKAANRLKSEPDIKFTLIGDGFQFEKAKALAENLKLKNIHFKGWVPFSELNKEINNFDLCLGIFGETIKTESVIPNKVYHYAACKKPILTKETPAIREIFTDNVDIKLCGSNDSDIAENILRLKRDINLRKMLGENSRDLMLRNLTDYKIVEKLLNKLEILNE